MGDPELVSEEAHVRDLAELRRLERDHGSLERGTAEWLEHEVVVAILSRRIRDWVTDEDMAFSAS